MLQTILGLERLERMTSFAAELAGLELGDMGFPQATPASSSMLTGSVGATSAASSPLSAGTSAAGGADGGYSPLLAGAIAAAAAAAAADEEGSEASSRRWTEGSGTTAAEDQQQQHSGGEGAGELAGALQQLALSEEQQQGQGLEQRRPSRPSQVSPHCPQPQPASRGEDTAEGGVANSREATPAAAAVEEGQEMSTPPDNIIIPGAAAGGLGPTPFFTPAGTSSVLGTPASRSVMQPLVPVVRSAAAPSGASWTTAWQQQERTAAAAVTAALLLALRAWQQRHRQHQH